MEEGFRGGLEASSTEIVVTKYGDTGKEIQVILHVGPAIQIVTPENVDVIGTTESLAPASFTPTFVVE